MLKTSHTKDQIEAGCDEAGRGCLAGPVFAAAVILSKNFKHEFLNDSKKLTLKQRILIRSEIESQALAWAVASVNNEKIDEINILNASILAMHKAINKLSIEPQLILVDGNRFKKYNQIAHECFVKGDSRYLSIAAASVLAKTYRDEYMEKIHLKYPEYSWNKNKGYPTKKHKLAISSFGITDYHRKSFRLNEQLKISFGK